MPRSPTSHRGRNYDPAGSRTGHAFQSGWTSKSSDRGTWRTVGSCGAAANQDAELEDDGTVKGPDHRLVTASAGDTVKAAGERSQSEAMSGRRRAGSRYSMESAARTTGLSMIVLKFGGTSLASPQRITAVADIVRKKRETSEIAVVVSAMAGPTHSATLPALPAGRAEYRETIESLRERHREVIDELADEQALDSRSHLSVGSV